MSFVQLLGNYQGKCGYCKGQGSKSYSLWGYELSVSDYQQLLDMGWSRSGQYVYKPDLEYCCCPQYTIRLPVQEFKPSKSQLKVIKRLEKLFEAEPTLNKKDWLQLMQWLNNHPQLKIKLEPSKFQQDSFELFVRYQQRVHQESSGLSEESYARFLVDTPLKYTQQLDDLPYGSYHLKYYLDNKLIAVDYLDLLPQCIVSNYFIYCPDTNHLSLGVFSALQGIYLSIKLSKQAAYEQCLFYYMGYYVHSCSKMNYKANYKPSMLLCPMTMQWVYLKDCLELFKSNNRPCPSQNMPIKTPSNLDASEQLKNKVMNRQVLLMSKHELVKVRDYPEIYDNLLLFYLRVNEAKFIDKMTILV